MELKAYPFTRINYYYQFYSNGPNGIIEKGVEYCLLSRSGDEIYNLSFGDWDNECNCINDLSVTDNRDTQKVLATIASTVIDFMTRHPHAVLFAKGSTATRTRLYQVNINKMLLEIEKSFKVYGYFNNKWELFRKGINYDSFMLKAK